MDKNNTNRLKFHEELCKLLGSRNVYHQPPASVKMKYPAIRYKRTDLDRRFANNKIYINAISYSVIVIDPNPDSVIASKMDQFPFASFDTSYTADNLNHYVYTVTRY